MFSKDYYFLLKLSTFTHKGLPNPSRFSIEPRILTPSTENRYTHGYVAEVFAEVFGGSALVGDYQFLKKCLAEVFRGSDCVSVLIFQAKYGVNICC